MNFNGVAKGDPRPAGFGGVIRYSEGRILSVFWGGIGTNTNNMAELEGLVNEINWALKQ